jgi:hypothetical protein
MTCHRGSHARSRARDLFSYAGADRERVAPLVHALEHDCGAVEIHMKNPFLATPDWATHERRV